MNTDIGSHVLGTDGEDLKKWKMIVKKEKETISNKESDKYLLTIAQSAKCCIEEKGNETQLCSKDLIIQWDGWWAYGLLQHSTM